MKSPNILILMADQLAPHYTGTYGHPVVKTPNIDRLAEYGARFDAAYTNYPLCAPSRFSFMSGQLPFKIRAYDNAAEFSSAIPTFCHYLRQMGYHSCLSGKMHFIGPDQLHGFSERLTTEIYPSDFAFTPDWKHADQRIDEWYHNMVSVTEAGTADMTFQLDYDDEVGFWAIRKLNEYARYSRQTPFLMVTSFTHPHDPYVARPQWWDQYDHNLIDLPQIGLNSVETDPHSQRIISGIQADVEQPTDEMILNARHGYYANTTYFDDWVGQFIDTLKRTKLIDNTIVIVTADHGDMLGERGLWYKMHFFEQSVRIPLVIAGPGIKHRTIPDLCSSVDFLPTLLDFAADGSDRIPEFENSMDGHSLRPLLTDGSSNSRNTVISQYSAECTAHPMVMIRRGNLKYIHCASDPTLLFDLEADPLEQTNLAQNSDYRDEVASFEKEIEEQWDLNIIREDVIRSQQSRLFIHNAMKQTPYTDWDFQPHTAASEQYVRTHRELDDIAIKSRFPLYSPTKS